ncbi:MAG TPA: asparagine--tRNA ligase, partial [Flavobacteriaceae bacterium]|nr:asparagine--tRNA ligase [Flavobacteriaceae bacterium]
MKATSIATILEMEPSLIEIKARGWVRSFRSNRFIALNDGSTIKNIQCVVDFENFEEEVLNDITTGAAIEVIGTLVESQGKGQAVEIQVSKV